MDNTSLEPYFTICIPTYNRANLLIRTLESIRKQQFDSYEVLIIDDGSVDNTREVVETYITNYGLEKKYKYYYKVNGGKHTAINVGLDNATGKYFIIFDSDDYFTEKAFENIYNYCQKIDNDMSYSGVMGRSIDISNNKIIGDLFAKEDLISSYFDYHFVLPFKMDIIDCLSVDKTEILKKYRFPEPDNTKFVNEAWLFDQIGVRYKMLLTNDVFRYVEYQQDGITKNQKVFKERNIVGFLYHYISRIENVLPYASIRGMQKVKLYVIAWWRYWEAVKIDSNNLGPRIDRVFITRTNCKGNNAFIEYCCKACSCEMI